MGVNWRLRLQDFQELKVWRKAHSLTLAVYGVTRRFPPDERFGLTSQMRRAAASIGANLAEGCCRNGDADFARFVQIAMGSASELKYFFFLSRDLELIVSEDIDNLLENVNEVQRMLASLIGTLRGRKLMAKS